MPNNKYLFYACYKNGHNGGVSYSGRKTAKEAKNDLLHLINTYLTNDVVFMGIVKCSDEHPLNHIRNLNE